MKALLLFLIIFIIEVRGLEAQKNQRGSSADKTWKYPVNKGALANSIGSNEFYSKLSFGKWHFSAVYGYPEILNIADEKNYLPPNPKQHIFNRAGSYHTRTLTRITNDISVECTDAANQSFKLQFDILDSLGESFDKTIGFPMDEVRDNKEDYSEDLYKRQLTGYLVSSGYDSIPFSFCINFINPFQNITSSVFTGQDTVLIKHLYNKSGYGGFEFYQNKELAGSVYRKKPDTQYHYWISPETSSGSQQVIAAIIFMTIGFVK